MRVSGRIFESLPLTTNPIRGGLELFNFVQKGSTMDERYKQPTFSKTWCSTRSPAAMLHACLLWLWGKHEHITGEDES